MARDSECKLANEPILAPSFVGGGQGIFQGICSMPEHELRPFFDRLQKRKFRQRQPQSSQFNKVLASANTAIELTRDQDYCAKELNI